MKLFFPDEEDNLKWTGHSGSVPPCHQRVAQSFPPSVIDSPRFEHGFVEALLVFK